MVLYYKLCGLRVFTENLHGTSCPVMCDLIYQLFEAHLQTDVGRWKALDMLSSELHVPLNYQEEDCLCVAPLALRLKAIVK